MRVIKIIFIVILLCAAAACIKTPDELVIPPIHQALMANDAVKVRQFASGKDQLSSLNEYGEPPLLYAVKQKKTKLADILLAQGADPNEQNLSDGETPLIASVKNNDIMMVKRLLEAGAQTDKHDNTGTSPLQWAVRRNNLPIVKMIFAKSGTGSSDNLSTPLLESAAYGSNEMLKYLVSIGAPVNASTENGETALILASRFGHLEIIQNLLTMPVNLNAVDTDGASSLTWAARLGRTQIVQLLLDAGIKIDQQDKFSLTPLGHAVRLGHLEIVDKLLEKNASVNPEMNKGFSIIYLAAFQDVIADKLNKAGAVIKKIEDNDVDPIEPAVRYLWLARFYQKNLIDKTETGIDRDNAITCYRFASDYFEIASSQYEETAKDIKNAEMWKKIGLVVLLAADATASYYNSQIQAKQMAEIRALGNASSQGTGISGYYSALSDSRKLFSTTTSKLLIDASNNPSFNTSVGLSGLVSISGSSTAPDDEKNQKSGAFLETEAKKCSESALACQEIIKCFEVDESSSDSRQVCIEENNQRIQYLK